MPGATPVRTHPRGASPARNNDNDASELHYGGHGDAKASLAAGLAPVGCPVPGEGQVTMTTNQPTNRVAALVSTDVTGVVPPCRPLPYLRPPRGVVYVCDAFTQTRTNLVGTSACTDDPDIAGRPQLSQKETDPAITTAEAHIKQVAASWAAAPAATPADSPDPPTATINPGDVADDDASSVGKTASSAGKTAGVDAAPATVGGNVATVCEEHRADGTGERAREQRPRRIAAVWSLGQREL